MFGGDNNNDNMNGYGGGGGGGFMQESSSQAQSGSGKKNYGDKGMLPVSIKQLLEAKQDGPDDNYRVDGRDTNQLTLVALILGVIENSSSVCYTLDDGTGTIDARVWIEQDESETHLQARGELKEGVYVRVVGSMRMHQDKRSLVAFNTRKISDFNELTYHLLDVCQAHLYNTRGAPPNGSGGKPGANSSTFFSPGRPGAAPGGNNNSNAGGNSGGAGGPVQSGLPLKDAVMQALQGRDDGDQGTSIPSIAQAVGQMLGRNVTNNDVKGVTTELTMDGVLYSTIDEEHFKLCDA